MSTARIAKEIKRYLRTGDADMDARAWPGDYLERGQLQHADLRGALVEEVRRLAGARLERTPRVVLRIACPRVSMTGT